MAKVTFDKSQKVETRTEAVPTPVPDVTVECVTSVGGVASSLPVPASLPVSAPAGLVGGEDNIDFRDIVLPKIHIGQGVGDIGRDFGMGEIVFDQKLKLPRPVEFFVLGFLPTRFSERTTGGELGNICDTEAEVVACGGTTDWNEAEETSKPLYQRLATAVLLIKQPEGVTCDDFSYEHNGAKYSLALWAMKGSAYTHGAKTLFTARKIGTLRKSWFAHSYKLTTKDEKFRTGNRAFIPVLEKGSPAPEGFDAFARAICACEA